MSLSRVLPTSPVRWALLLPLTVGLALTGVPANAAPAPAPATITGTVTFHEPAPDRTLEVFRQVGETWTEDQSLQTEVAADGSYAVHPPVGEPVRLRVSYGTQDYGYWFGDGFADVTGVSVEAPSTRKVTGVDLDVPAPSYLTGRVTDRAGKPVSAYVVPAVNNDGGLRPLTTRPLATTAGGTYTVILPAGYENGVLGLSEDGNHEAWLGGGGVSEPNFYINTTPGERRQVEDLVLPVGKPASAATPATPAVKPAPAPRLRALSTPAVRGVARKGHTLHANAGRWNLSPTTVRYQWLRNGSPIKRATKGTYRLTRADVRKRVSVRVTVARAGVRTAAYSVSYRKVLVRR